MFCLVTGLHNLLCRLCVRFIRSFGRCANTDLKEIGPGTWSRHRESRCWRGDMKYKAVESWIKWTKAVCRSIVAGKLTRNLTKDFLTTILIHCKNPVFKKPS